MSTRRLYVRQNGLIWDRYAERRTGPSQWDEISGRLYTPYATPALARAALTSRRFAIGLGFWTDADTLECGWGDGGIVVADVSLKGLFARKLSRRDTTKIEQWFWGNGYVNAPGWNPAVMYEQLRVLIPTVSFEVITYSELAPDMSMIGKTVSSHWSVSLTGGFPPPPPNPFVIGSGADAITNYPDNWWLDIQPSEQVGPVIGLGSSKLHGVTYKFSYQWRTTPG